MDFHDIVKTLYARKLLRKYKHNKTWIRIYTEFVIKDGKKCDLYFENIKTKESYVVEFQKEDSKQWENDIVEFYKDFIPAGMNTMDLVIVRLKKLSKNLDELNNQLDEYIF